MVAQLGIAAAAAKKEMRSFSVAAPVAVALLAESRGFGFSTCRL